MTTNPPDSPRLQIIEAAMACIGEAGWSGCTTEEICSRAGVERAVFYGEFDGPRAVVAAASRRLDAEMLAAAADFEPDEGVRDKLFALLMARFDAAGRWRKAIARLARAAATDPMLAAVGMNALRTSAARALDAAGVRTRGVLGPARIAALVAGVLLPVGRVWLADDSEDQGKTMAALDRRLDRLDRLAGRLGPLGGERKAARRREPSRAPVPKPARAEPAAPRKAGATGKPPPEEHQGGTSSGGPGKRGSAAAGKSASSGRSKAKSKTGGQRSGARGKGGSDPKSGDR